MEINSAGIRLSSGAVFALPWSFVILIAIVFIVCIVMRIAAAGKHTAYHTRHHAFVSSLITKKSARYAALCSLSSYRAKFHNLSMCYEFDYKCKTDFDIDAFNFDRTFRSLIWNRESEFYELVSRAKQNERLWLQYEDDLKKLPDYAFSINPLLAQEKKLCDRQCIHEPVTRFSVTLHAFSPDKKRMKQASYGFERVIQELHDVKEKKDADCNDRRQAKKERSKMTPKLRYEVLKRDGFRCVMCGASASDGALLEVDHIVPVSKGGETIEENLQTLCRECNRGKGVDTAG